MNFAILVLVNDRGETILLDFGIAKFLDTAEDDGPGPETVATLALSLPYSSPEQVCGGAMTTATDVYSLGVLLYELVCGALPYSAQQPSLAHYRNALDRNAPPPPSRRLQTGGGEAEQASLQRRAALRRERSPRGLMRRLQGDLDGIVLRAIHKEPGRRYATVQQLCEDLERHLDNRVVSANRGTWSFRLRKYARRHRVAFLATATLAAVVLGFLGYSSLQRARVLRERDRATTAYEVLRDFFKLTDADELRDEPMTALEFLEKGGNRLPLDAVTPIELRAELYTLLGETYLKLGFHDLAEPLAVGGLDLRRASFGDGDVRTAESYHLLGALRYQQSRYEEAEAALRRALTVRRVRGNRGAVAESALLLGQLLRAQGRREQALDPLQEALAIQEELLPAHDPALAKTRLELGYTLLLLGSYDRSERLLLNALEIQITMEPGAHPLTARILRELANLNLRQGRLPQAAGFLEQSLAQNRRLFGHSHKAIAVNLHDLGRLQQRLGNEAEAENYYWESLSVKEEVLGPEHSGLAGTVHNLALLAHRRGAFVEAELLFLRALDLHRASMGENINLAFQLLGYGALLVDMGRYPEAEADLCHAIDLFAKYSSMPGRRIAQCKCILARVYWEQGGVGSARDLLAENLPLLEQGSDERTQAERLWSQVASR